MAPTVTRRGQVGAEGEAVAGVGDVVGAHLVHAQRLELLADGVGDGEHPGRLEPGGALDDQEQDRRRQGQHGEATVFQK